MLPVAPDACTATCSDFDSVDKSCYDCVLQEYVLYPSACIHVYMTLSVSIIMYIYTYVFIYMIIYKRLYDIHVYIYIYIMNLYHLLTIMGLFG